MKVIKVKVELSDRVAEQMQELLTVGWFMNEQELVRRALTDYVRRDFALIEQQQLEDVDWAAQVAGVNPLETTN